MCFEIDWESLAIARWGVSPEGKKFDRTLTYFVRNDTDIEGQQMKQLHPLRFRKKIAMNGGFFISSNCTFREYFSDLSPISLSVQSLG